MKRPVTYWYTKDQPIFENTDDFQSVIDVTRIPAGSDSPPCLKISHNTFETMEKANWEFLRLSLPVICLPTFIEFVIPNTIKLKPSRFKYNFFFYNTLMMSCNFVINITIIIFLLFYDIFFVLLSKYCFQNILVNC